jgi:hypothetical protein
VTKRKPSLANPPGRVTSPSPSIPPSKGRNSIPRRYAQGSPLRESILRASASAQGLGEGRRLPSQAPGFDLSQKSSSSASPLATFLARKQERMASGGDMGDLSWDGDAGAYWTTLLFCLHNSYLTLTLLALSLSHALTRIRFEH